MSAEKQKAQDSMDHAGGRASQPEGPLPSPRFTRRAFLKTAGFAVPAVTLGACSRAPVENAIPFLVQPERVVPGTSLWYASTCFACEAGCGLLVKNRDGRPIKLEGNAAHPLSRGGLCARGQAAVLELYDEQRLSAPLRSGKEASWEQVDREIMAGLEAARGAGEAVRVLTGTLVSPTVERVLQRFLATFGDARHVVYDPLSHSAILDAHRQTHGARLLPRYRFDRADVIVGLDADFLGTWISPVEHTVAWSEGRRPTAEKPAMSYHLQVESRLSITGSKADQRWAVRPGEIRIVVARLLAAVARRGGRADLPVPSDPGRVPQEKIEELAGRMWEARGRSLVVCGVNDLDLQTECNQLNHLLGGYGATLDLEHPSRQAAGDDRDLAGLIGELREKKVGVLMVAGVNPAYDLAGIPKIEELLGSVSLLVSFARWRDETSRVARFVCPDNHPLESWGDAQPVAGLFSLAQPVIAPLGRTRALIETLARWSADSASGIPASARELVRETWKKDVFARARDAGDFDLLWNNALERGVAEVVVGPASTELFAEPEVRGPARTGSQGGTELVLHPSPAMGDGRHAANPWLHELPDPISKVTWDNVAALSAADAERWGLTQGDVVRLEVAGEDAGTPGVELPVFIQPGQAPGTVAVAVGYGRTGSERFVTLGPDWIEAPSRSGTPRPVGANAWPFVDFASHGLRRMSRANVTVSRTEKHQPLACTQPYRTLEVPDKFKIAGGEEREIVRRLSLESLAAGESVEGAATGERHKLTLWPDDHIYSGHHWALVVDLNTCTGCSACVIGCQAENNIPPVGRDEVRRRREMQWLRIDSYYSGDDSRVEMVHQPMMCQQCDNAPCETVCPVLATVHSAEGLNEQVYNRCVGTRYCANNCPYKARRFNWFNYHKKGSREDLVLNPDVTVRSRGIMEKCTFCVQRIAAGKMEAKQRGVALADGMIRVACEQSCPAGAIVFGDLNDAGSRVARLIGSSRRYRVLEELGVRPSVNYLAVVRRGRGGEEEQHHG